MPDNKYGFLVGLFVLTGVAATVFTAFQVSGMSDWFHRSGYNVRVEFNNIGSLRKNSAVSASGILVGRVVDIGYDAEKYKAWALINIENRYKFPIDTRASIRTAGLLGEQFIALDPGLEDDMLLAGDDILDSDSALVLEDLIGKLVSAVAEGD